MADVDLQSIEDVYNKFMNTTEGSEGLVLQSIQSEFAAGRIKGTDYANVYLGVMQTAMQLALQGQEIGEKAITQQYEQQALKAKIEDENGMIITPDSIVESTSQGTKHHWTVEKLKKEDTLAEEQIDVTINQATKLEREADSLAGKNYHEYGYNTAGYAFTSPNMTLDGTPNTALEASMLKSLVEAEVGNKTAAGYKADSYYKQGRALYELYFATANAGVISKPTTSAGNFDTNTFYQRTMTSIEKSLNRQAEVWETGSAYVDLNGTGTPAEET